MDGDSAKLMPMDNVYSYFMFVSPIERKKNSRTVSWTKVLAWVLVTVNFFLQGTILFAVFNDVVASDVVWRDSILSLAGKSVNPFAPPPSKCNPGGSLCFEQNHTFTCAPPSVQLAGRWNDLDLNGDGIWTREEVLTAQENLKCRYAVDPLEVFNVFVSFLKNRADVIWLHPMVKAGQALHKPYFDFAKGDIIMCNYRNEEMCPNLLKRGFFDSPLTSGESPRVGKTIESALDYCYELLRKGGVCERTLPSTYSVWRQSSDQQCGTQIYHNFEYTHPKTGMTKSVLELDYKAVEDYEKGRVSKLFLVYKAIIMGMFVLCMFVELKDILVVVTWILTYPGEEDVDEAVKEEKDAEGKVEKYIIQGVSIRHRMMVGLLTLGRFVLTFLLTWVGTVFLLQDTDYVNLLLNVVALVFVVEIGSCLYGQLLDVELREQCENTAPFVVNMASIWKFLWFRNPAVRDIFGLSCVIAIVGGGMYMHYIHIAKPLSTALECTCLSQGDRCFEAQTFDTNFWGNYWAEDVPQVFTSVERMKRKHEAETDDDSDSAPHFIRIGADDFTTLQKAEDMPLQDDRDKHSKRHRMRRLFNIGSQ